MNEVKNIADVYACKRTGPWINVREQMPDEFVSVLGFMDDAGDFPPVRECYNVCGNFFFPALREIHPVSYWMHMPSPPVVEE